MVNALEATGLGAANLTDGKLPLNVTVTGGGEGSPKVTPRVARFFVTTNAMYVPDALLATDSPQTIPSGESMLVWLSAESTGAKPGNYNYQVTVSVGNNVHTIPLEIHVHNVVLSTKTPLSTLNWSYIDTDEYPNLNLSKLRNSMLEHRITVGGIHPGTVPFPKKDKEGNVLRPVQLDFSRMDRMLEFHKDFPKIGFYMPFDHPGYIYDYTGNAKWMSEQFKDICREFVVAVIEHIKASGRDYDSFYLQLFDETLDEKASDFYGFVHSIDPKVRLMLTIPQASADGTKEIVKAGTNIFDYCATPLLREGEYDNVPDGFPVLSSNGRELWFYSAADSRTGLGKERDPLNCYRLMHWFAFQHGATGVGFWNMFRNTPRERTGGWGDESISDSYWPFVYVMTDEYPVPADVKTAEKFIPSRRWEYARMGIEDYMLLKMAQERIASLGNTGNSWHKQLEEIVRTVLTTRDRNLFRAKRRELVELIEKLQSSK
ncbi:MAG: hypothetical protein HY559_01095 [Gammaproteobacteria bacterium]|nr:hypothetical protein [Gammaproteobacteria bacterium]